MKDEISEVKETGLPIIAAGTCIDGASASGEAVVNGKRYYWEMHDYCGPLFTRKDGEPLKNKPSSKHPVWPSFNVWLKKYELSKSCEKAFRGAP